METASGWRGRDHPESSIPGGLAPALPFLLRRELRFHPGPPHPDGSPSWMIHDPVRQRFFRMGWVERIVMDHPGLTPETLGMQVRALGGPTISPEQVIRVRDFLVQNELVMATSAAMTQTLLQQRQRQTQGWLRRLWHGWLFFRVPLVNPDSFLVRWGGLWRLLGHPMVWVAVVVMGLVGATNTARHWDMFLATFPHFFSFAGWIWYGGAILGAKLVHELGHAATASRYGCRVPTMGVAFMLFWPVFYTDVGEAWLLRSQKERFLIGAGGVLAELGLAAVALFLWPFVSEGPARSALVLLAGVIWVGTVVINLNPFMRFDGYFLLSDALGVPNLQQQAFALGRWRMREWLFGWGLPEPHGARDRLGRFLTFFAYAVWMYRAIFFIGFALVVYFMVFKVAGLVLLLAEVGWFVVRPVALEMGVWWQNRHLFHWNGTVVRTILIGAGIFSLVAVIPWEGSVRAPAMGKAGWYQAMFSPVGARVRQIWVTWDQAVEKDQELMVLDAPDLALSLEQNRLTIERLQWDMGHGASEFTVGDKQLVVARELASALGERDGLLREAALLRVRAPFAGVVKFMAEGMEPGVWVDSKQPLVAIMRLQPVRVEAFVTEEEIDRVLGTSQATFIPAELGRPSRELKVDRIENQAVEFLKDSAFASTHGGPLAVRQDRNGRLVPEKGCFRVWLSPVLAWSDLDRVAPGTVRFAVAPRTVLERFWHPIWAALIRQTDF
ncbi:MAG: HlyD family efflux transporter periplasmic adaptor subunit [Magnetococcales bacterium]|nr:HlyD family efflux transporter periplasmic adaptor subunit [Magnetococcales bacterium]